MHVLPEQAYIAHHTLYEVVIDRASVLTDARHANSPITTGMVQVDGADVCLQPIACLHCTHQGCCHGSRHLDIL